MSFDLRPLSRFQAAFLDRVTAPDATGRFRIFHDTWFHGLLDGLADVYPGMRRALGEEAFKAFARDYIRSHPLDAGDQTLYGAAFAVFFESHPQGGDVAWLGDLARLEWAEHQAHHAADAVPCDFDDLLDADTRLALHPSVSSLHLAHDVDGVRGADDFTLERIDRRWLIGRDRHDDIVRLALTPEDGAFVDHLIARGALIAALEASPSDALPQLQTLLAHLVQAGFLISRTD